MNTIYCLPGRSQVGFVHRVHSILEKLRSWERSIPSSLRRWDPSSPRNVLSLHLSYNQCIIKTTRPILLHIFKRKLDCTTTGDFREQQSLSPTARALAEACIQAACTSNSILSRLFVEGNLATFGYLDALYLFSSTLILIISAVLEPHASISDAVQTAFQLLKSMAETGNFPARGYYDRLCTVRAALETSDLRSRHHCQTSLWNWQCLRRRMQTPKSCRNQAMLADGSLLACSESGLTNKILTLCA